MTIFQVLTREHRLFERLSSRLRGAGELGPSHGRARVAEVLLVLLPALQRHDALEETVFGRPRGEWPRDELLAGELVEAQHGALRELRSSIEAVLAGESKSTFPRLAELAELLADKLQWHFRSEEMLLWPLYAKRESRSLARSGLREAERGVRELEDSVESLEKAVRSVIEGAQ
jgi:hypothetical protein